LTLLPTLTARPLDSVSDMFRRNLLNNKCGHEIGFEQVCSRDEDMCWRNRGMYALCTTYR
jgi:hypothetical protein